jgi:Kef-type K+ transport system membrane component KefB
VHLFTPIFFVMVGLALNLREVTWSYVRKLVTA